jgi:hypothetical protein
MKNAGLEMSLSLRPLVSIVLIINSLVGTIEDIGGLVRWEAGDEAGWSYLTQPPPWHIPTGKCKAS